jgi:hypothetical protein
MSLSSRVDKLESSSTAGSIADRLGGTAVVLAENGRFKLHSGESITRAELDALLVGCRGHLIVLSSSGMEEIEYT